MSIQISCQASWYLESVAADGSIHGISMLKERIADDFDVSIAEFQSGRFDYKTVLTKETRKSSPIARRIPPPLKVSRLGVGSEISFTSKSAL